MHNVVQSRERPLFGTPVRLVFAMILVFGGSFAAFQLIRDGFYPLASILIAIVVFLVLIIIKKSLTPWRWLATGVILAVFFTVFPIFYTVYLSFTTMSGGHLLTKQQAISRIVDQKYTPDDAENYSWTAYGGPNNWTLLLTDQNDNQFLARPGKALVPFASGEAPEAIDGAKKLDEIDLMQNLQALSNLDFGLSPETIKIQTLGNAVLQKSQYRYDAEHDSIQDLANAEVYKPVHGTFTAESGATLIPGFIVSAGFSNYSQFLGNDGYRKPMIEIIIWNIMFSLLSVFFSFVIGLTIALLFENLKGKRIIRALLIIPYPIPVLVSIMVWRALLNERMGLVTSFLTAIFGSAPLFFTDAAWTRFAVILINVYLSYPYFFIICSGALKSIPRDLYEAADMDGAGPFQVLKGITLPMLLRILMPLLIASFCFNFNNFTIIWGFNAGLPAMADSIVPMGHTDLLISFIYRLGFSNSNAADYGFSAAITVLLFIFVGLMVFFQTLNTRTIKEAD